MNKAKICPSGKEFYRKRKELKKGVPVKWYSQGRKYEYKAIQELKEKEGCFLAVRSPGSKGIFDVFGLKIDGKDMCLYLVQVKALKKTSTVKRALPRQERIILLKAVKNNLFPFWRGKKEIVNRGRPQWATKLFIELWIWEKRISWHKFRLDLATLEFKSREPEIIEAN